MRSDINKFPLCTQEILHFHNEFLKHCTGCGVEARERRVLVEQPFRILSIAGEVRVPRMDNL